MTSDKRPQGGNDRKKTMVGSDVSVAISGREPVVDGLFGPPPSPSDGPVRYGEISPERIDAIVKARFSELTFPHGLVRDVFASTRATSKPGLVFSSFLAVLAIIIAGLGMWVDVPNSDLLGLGGFLAAVLAAIWSRTGSVLPKTENGGKPPVPLPKTRGNQGRTTN